MKKFLGGVKKNIFYISLITGMAVLVTVLGLYNAKTNSNDKNIISKQNTSEESLQTKETLSDKNGDKKTDAAEAVTEDTTDVQNTEAEAEVTDEEAGPESADSVETGVNGSDVELHYDPANSIEWPLAGNVIIPYSMDSTVYFETLKEYKCSPAMVIEAAKGAEVKAVYESKVAEVSSNSELGNYVKLELGDGYTVTLGQLQDVKVALGEHLEAGDVVGTIGEPSRFYSEEGSNLYFAVEKDGNPVDPMLLIQ